MLYLLLALIIITAFFVTLEWPELGFGLVIIIPLVKDLFQLPEDQIPFLNLLFLFAIFVLIAMLYKFSFKMNEVKLNREHLGLFIIFTAILLFSLNYTNELIYGADKVLKFILFNGLYFIGGMIVFQYPIKQNRFIEFLKYSILTIAIINTIFLIKHFVSGTLLQHIMVRFTLLESNSPISMARITGLGVLLWFIAAFQSKNSKNKLFASLAIIPLAVSLVATNTRGPILFSLLLIFVFVFFYLKISMTKKLTFLGIFISIIIIFVLILPANTFNRFLLLFHKASINANQSVWSAGSSARRVIFIKRLLVYLGQHPATLFIGSGAGSFADLFQDYGVCLYPHNLFFEVLFEQGLLGFTILIISITILIRDIYIYYYKKGNMTNDILIFVFGFMYFFLNAMISGDVDSNRILWLFWGGIIGMIISQQNNIHKLEF
ncbi:MAG: O-antigen ligase family protein [Candidatus Marinimicrobia bacterium]|nr:O-antigen ligase family protein [Candidatus Neomarinimicrobiota bacterium]